MPLTVDDFQIPEKHPYGMLGGYRHTAEKESTLAFILKKCIHAGDLYTMIPLSLNHRDMVSDNLLVEFPDNHYRLTTKAIGLLYSVYAKE